jgi:hypothetical protein
MSYNKNMYTAQGSHKTERLILYGKDQELSSSKQYFTLNLILSAK